MIHRANFKEIILYEKLSESTIPHGKMRKQRRQKCAHESWDSHGKASACTDACQTKTIIKAPTYMTNLLHDHRSVLCSAYERINM